MPVCLVVPFVLSLFVVLIRKSPKPLKVIFPVPMLAVAPVGSVFLNGVGGHTEFRAFDNEDEGLTTEIVSSSVEFTSPLFIITCS